MNPRKPETVSVRVREQTYSSVRSLASEQGIKAVEIWDIMLEAYKEKLKQPTPQEPAPRTAIDSEGRSVGSYLQSM